MNKESFQEVKIEADKAGVSAVLVGEECHLEYNGRKMITAYAGKAEKFVIYSALGFKNPTKTVALGHL